MPLRKICILGFDDYAMLSGGDGYIGGECVQHVLLARAWRDLGLDVSIVVHAEGQPRVTRIDGIRAIAAFTPNSGLPLLRFVHPRVTSVLRAMREADADVYYQSPSSAFTGVAAWFARRRGKLSIARIASDLGCIPGRQLIRYWRDRKLYDYGLRSASLIAAQTQYQRTLLKQHYGLESEVINMVVEVPPAPARRERDIDVLWVGNLREVKRPELVLALARSLPQYRFAIAGGPLPAQQQYYQRFVAAAAAVPNLELLGPVPYEKVGALFERARLHLNTSSAEGFPNTFLQAWTREVPVVSFFDPDSLIRRRMLGRAVTELEEMTRALAELLEAPRQREEMGRRAREFVAAEFSAAGVARRYLELMQALQETRLATRDSRLVGVGAASGAIRDETGG